MLHNLEGAILDVNEQASEDLGYPHEDLLSMEISEIEVGFDHEELETVWRGLDKGERTRVDGRHRRADGSTYPVEVTLRKIDLSGKERVLAFCRDITEQKEHERELRRLKEEYETVFNSAQDGIFLFNVDETDGEYEFTLQNLNPAHEAVSDMSIEADRGKTPKEFLGDEQGQKVVENYRRCVAAKAPISYEEELEMPAGTIYWHTILAPVIEDDEVTRLVGIARDITERKERERNLTETKQRLELALQESDAGIWEWDISTDELYWSDELLAVLGYSEDEFSGSIGFLTEKLHPDDVERTETAIETALETGQQYHVEQRIETADGEYRWIDVRGQVIEDQDAARMVGVGFDITERKQYEQRLEHQQANLQLLNEVLRHDIRNNLTVIKGYAELLVDNVDQAAEADVRTIQETTDDAIDLTKTARDLAEVMLQRGTEAKAMSLTDALEAQLQEVRTGYPEATVTVEGPVPNVSVIADELLEAVFRNLLQNAIQHNDKDVPEVVVSAEESDAVVQVQIADNGPGISDSRKEEIFARGEKGLESGGAGLGLYLVETLVNRYSGDVWVEDNDPEGSVFVVELPIAE